MNAQAPPWYDSYLALQRTGWSVRDIEFQTPEGSAWVVLGQNGKKQLRAEGPSQDAAWWGAVAQARAMGMEISVASE
jgi:hypothetical protein